MFNHVAGRGALCAIGAVMLCAPALYNGYPILFADLLDYGVDGMRIARAMWPTGNHPPFYGVAIELLDFERTLWPVVFVQGLIVTHLVQVVLRTIDARLSPLAFLGFVAGLTLLTSLPWYVSTVMPDLFGGVLVLCLFLLLFRSQCLGSVERPYFAVLSVACLLFHLSFFPVAVGIVALAVGLRLVRRRASIRPRFGIGLAVLMTAMAVSSLVSLKFWGDLKGPPYAPPYLLAHVLVDGPGKEFLKQRCGVQSFALCDYQENIPDDVEDFMFRAYSPLFSSWETRAIRAEAPAIVAGTLEMFPAQTIAAFFRDGMRQVVTFYTEVAQLEDIPNDHDGSYGTEFAIRLPFVAKGYVGSAQEAGLLGPDHLKLMNHLHAVVVAASGLLALVQIARAAARGHGAVLELLLVVIAAVAINGFVAGAAVGVFGRFGARMIWLLPFGAVAALLAVRPSRRDAALAPPRRLFGMPVTALRLRSD